MLQNGLSWNFKTWFRYSLPKDSFYHKIETFVLKKHLKKSFVAVTGTQKNAFHDWSISNRLVFLSIIYPSSYIVTNTMHTVSKDLIWYFINNKHMVEWVLTNDLIRTAVQ